MRVLALLPPLLFAVGCGPIVMIPGGELSGTVQPLPADWAFSDAFDTVQLETRPQDPYSVNVWAVAAADAIFVAAGGGLETAWAQHIEADERVRLRIEDALYELRATREDDPATRERVLQALQKKYDFEPDDEDTAKAILYRLDRRG